MQVKKIWLVGGTILTLAFCAEIFLRLTVPPPEPLQKSYLPGFFYKLKPNQSWGIYRTNKWGLRGDNGFIGDNPILCIGDSITFGAYVAEKDTFEYQLESMIRGRYAVINAGVGGWNLWDYKAQLDLLMPIFHPKVVVIGLFMNDHIPWTRLDRIDFDGDIHSALYRRLHAQRDGLWWTYRRFRYPWQDILINEIDSESTKSVTAFVEATGGHPQFPSLVAYIVKQMNEISKWDIAMKIVESMQRTCTANHAHLIVVIFPVSFQIQYGYEWPQPQRFIDQTLSQHGIDHIDMRPIFEKECQKELCYNNIYDTAHFNPYAHRLVAKAINRRLKSLALTVPVHTSP